MAANFTQYHGQQKKNKKSDNYMSPSKRFIEQFIKF